MSQKTFRMEKLPSSEARIDRLSEAMDRFELAPSYQRQSDVWGEDKRQLFIDSLINGYDVPKLYFHRLEGKAPPSPLFAIVDGKQRLEAIEAFVKSEFALSDDFVDSEDQEEADLAAGHTFAQLTAAFPAISGRLMRRTLDIVVVETDDLEVIEELFSRLNEAVPLNAPEKRNAFGGPMPPVIRSLVREHEFFTDRLPIENTRYKQYDLVTKFLYLEAKGGFPSTKKRDLDAFVREFRDRPDKQKALGEAKELGGGVDKVLDAMSEVFESQDELLASVGLVTVYYIAFLLARKNKVLKSKLTRDRLLEFDELRRHNRSLLRRQQAAVAKGEPINTKSAIRQDLAIFDRLMQSPNDSQALEYRLRILRAFLENRKFRDALPTGLKQRLGA